MIQAHELCRPGRAARLETRCRRTTGTVPFSPKLCWQGKGLLGLKLLWPYVMRHYHCAPAKGSVLAARFETSTSAPLPEGYRCSRGQVRAASLKLLWQSVLLVGIPDGRRGRELEMLRALFGLSVQWWLGLKVAHLILPCWKGLVRGDPA